MKGLICYFSGTGNTKLACKYIAKKVITLEFDMHDVRKGIPDFQKYSFIGFATYSDEFSISKYMKEFIVKLPTSNLPAFVFSTFGRNNGNTTRILADNVSKRGFKVVADYALHTPENYPPVIKIDKSYAEYPKQKDMEEFDSFIAELNEIGKKLKNKEMIISKKVKVKLQYKLMPDFSNRRLVQWVMGAKIIDKGRCTKCGLCVKICPYDAISLEDKYPNFEESKCHGCFNCYNRCPTKALYTKKYKDFGHYPKPNSNVINRLKISQNTHKNK